MGVPATQRHFQKRTYRFVDLVTYTASEEHDVVLNVQSRRQWVAGSLYLNDHASTVVRRKRKYRVHLLKETYLQIHMVWSRRIHGKVRQIYISLQQRLKFSFCLLSNFFQMLHGHRVFQYINALLLCRNSRLQNHDTHIHKHIHKIDTWSYLHIVTLLHAW
jgi:hypothetical protein